MNGMCIRPVQAQDGAGRSTTVCEQMLESSGALHCEAREWPRSLWEQVLVQKSDRQDYRFEETLGLNGFNMHFTEM